MKIKKGALEIEKTKYYLAIDIGASHGRHIIGKYENKKLSLEEIYSFENSCRPYDNCLSWDLDYLEKEVIKGIKICKEKNMIPQTIGINTWGVDYVLLDGKDQPIKPVSAYRCPQNVKASEELEKIIASPELYEHTGIQKMVFNTIYQLFRDFKDGKLSEASTFLMMPEYFNFVLTGKKVREFTNHSTTSLLKAGENKFDFELIDKIGLPHKIFEGEIHTPGMVIGNLSENIKQQVGFDAQVILVASHDTASAVLGAPIGPDSIFLSSGTWSLIGIETDHPIKNKESQKLNFTNEGGFQNRNRFLKNIMGLWIVQNIKKELSEQKGNKVSFKEIIEIAESGKLINYFNVNDNIFLEPGPMISRIRKILNQSDETPVKDLLHSLYMSLAKCYAEAIANIEKLTHRTYSVINIVGGGSKDCLLNKMTKDITGKKVFAGPDETTAIGNILAQISVKENITDVNELREITKNSFKIMEVL